jgi:transcriptional regulator with XRE-family HTH domain
MKTQIGSGIRKVREAIGMPRRKLAALAGIGYPHLARLEIGTATLSLQTLDDIAAGLHVPVWVIAFEADTDEIEQQRLREIEAGEGEAADLAGAARLSGWRGQVARFAALYIELARELEQRDQAAGRREVPPADAVSHSASAGEDGAHHGSPGGSGPAGELDSDTAKTSGKPAEAHCHGDMCVQSMRCGGCECACATCWLTCCGFPKPEGEGSAEEHP